MLYIHFRLCAEEIINEQGGISRWITVGTERRFSLKRLKNKFYYMKFQRLDNKLAIFYYLSN